MWTRASSGPPRIRADGFGWPQVVHVRVRGEHAVTAKVTWYKHHQTKLNSSRNVSFIGGEEFDFHDYNLLGDQAQPQILSNVGYPMCLLRYRPAGDSRLPLGTYIVQCTYRVDSVPLDTVVQITPV